MTNQSAKLTVRTLQGAFIGHPAEDSHITGFKGIPYAQAPIGPLRFKPPKALAKPSKARLAQPALADKPGPACWQTAKQDNFVWSRRDFAMSEDCLYLNIWTDLEGQGQPVMVWFHGGAHTVGMGHEQIFDGTELAKRGVVVVTLNYRLGPFGFLAHPALAAESDHNSAGNYGLLDKIAALNWVRDNIAQFGGNPDNVTIFGQSAGSQSVCSLMTSPFAEGLFHKAIGQSASCISPLPAQDENGFRRGEQLAAQLGPSVTADDLRKASPQQLLDAAENSGWANASRIVIDGWVLPENQFSTFKQGNQHSVPLLLGSLANEGHELFPVNTALTAQQLDAFLSKRLGPLGDRMRNLYPKHLSPGETQHAIATDLFMAYGMRLWADLHQQQQPNTFLYFLDHPTPAFRLYSPTEPDLALDGGAKSVGAYHSGDLAYVFGNTRKVGMGWDDDDHLLSQQMVTYWTQFAKTGNPNLADTKGLPNWPAYDSQQRQTQVFGSPTLTQNSVRGDILDLWDQVFFPND